MIRYNISVYYDGLDVEEDRDGDWVKYEDAQEAIEEAEIRQKKRYRKEIERLKRLILQSDMRNEI